MTRSTVSLFRRSRPIIKVHTRKASNLLSAGPAPICQPIPTLCNPPPHGVLLPSPRIPVSITALESECIE